MIVYEIWINIQEPTKFEFATYEEAKYYGITHFQEFYIQPKYKNDDKTYFKERRKNERH